MKLTSKKLKALIIETLLELSISPAAGFASDQGLQLPEELAAWLETQPVELDPEEVSPGKWIVRYDEDDVAAGLNTTMLPPGWSSLPGDSAGLYVISQDI